MLRARSRARVPVEMALICWMLSKPKPHDCALAELTPICEMAISERLVFHDLAPSGTSSDS